ncbi:MAG: 50S ribosomal protein L25/general stress protein Ctc, partial [Desulfobacterales bacterium]|nr:50S ribosomal protein L25/general stress protein Ctc [Desulfobacterales bacterium]
RELEVLCLPTAIPEAIEVDVSDLDVGDSIHVEDISLAGDIEIPADTNFTVVTILAPKVEEIVEEEELLEGEELEEGEEAAEEGAGEEAPSEDAKED